MPIIHGQKMSCESCIRGHRSTGCTHENVREMVAVRKPGRPLSRPNRCNCPRASSISATQSRHSCLSNNSSSDNRAASSRRAAKASRRRTQPQPGPRLMDTRQIDSLVGGTGNQHPDPGMAGMGNAPYGEPMLGVPATPAMPTPPDASDDPNHLSDPMQNMSLQASGSGPGHMTGPPLRTSRLQQMTPSSSPDSPSFGPQAHPNPSMTQLQVTLNSFPQLQFPRYFIPGMLGGQTNAGHPVGHHSYPPPQMPSMNFEEMNYMAAYQPRFFRHPVSQGILDQPPPPYTEVVAPIHYGSPSSMPTAGESPSHGGLPTIHYGSPSAMPTPDEFVTMDHSSPSQASEPTEVKVEQQQQQQSDGTGNHEYVTSNSDPSLPNHDFSFGETCTGDENCRCGICLFVNNLNGA